MKIRNLWKRLFRRPLRVDPDELNQQTAEVNATLNREANRMQSVANYLEKRKNQNGFGTDFEYTLRQRGAQ